MLLNYYLNDMLIWADNNITVIGYIYLNYMCTVSTSCGHNLCVAIPANNSRNGFDFATLFKLHGILMPPGRKFSGLPLNIINIKIDVKLFVWADPFLGKLCRNIGDMLVKDKRNVRF